MTLYAVREYNADGTSNGYTTTQPMSKVEAEHDADLHRKWADDDETGKTYEVTELELTFAEHHGPGRPKLDAADPTAKIAVTLPASLVKKAKALGDGNASAGVRLALEAFETTQETQDETQSRTS